MADPWLRTLALLTPTPAPIVTWPQHLTRVVLAPPDLEPDLELGEDLDARPCSLERWADLDAAIVRMVRQLGGGSVREVAAEVMAPKSTVHRRLTALRLKGQVHHDGRDWLPA